jgi:uncharacterized protein YqgC (DUF456 family)
VDALGLDSAALLYVLASLLIVVGLAGTVLPALPGLPVVFAGMLLAAWTDDFQRIGGWTVGILALVTVLALGIDALAALLGAKRVGASRLALLGAAIGSIVGLFFGLLGLIVGPFMGAVLGELAHSREAGLATKVGVGTWLGMVVGGIVKLSLAFAMLGIFLLALAL